MQAEGARVVFFSQTGAQEPLLANLLVAKLLKKSEKSGRSKAEWLPKVFVAKSTETSVEVYLFSASERGATLVAQPELLQQVNHQLEQSLLAAANTSLICIMVPGSALPNESPLQTTQPYCSNFIDPRHIAKPVQSKNSGPQMACCQNPKQTPSSFTFIKQEVLVLDGADVITPRNQITAGAPPATSPTNLAGSVAVNQSPRIVKRKQSPDEGLKAAAAARSPSTEVKRCRLSAKKTGQFQIHSSPRSNSAGHAEGKVARSSTGKENNRIGDGGEGMGGNPIRGKTSEYRGVSWSKSSKKWQAQIHFDGKQRHLGYFADEKEAARAYDRASRAHHGGKAKLNFPVATAPASVKAYLKQSTLSGLFAAAKRSSQCDKPYKHVGRCRNTPRESNQASVVVQPLQTQLFHMQIVQFTDLDGDRGSFRLQSSNTPKKLELWYDSHGTSQERLQQPDISIVVYNSSNGDVKVGSEGSALGGLFSIGDHATVMHKVKGMCLKAGAQFKIDGLDQQMQMQIHPKRATIEYGDSASMGVDVRVGHTLGPLTIPRNLGVRLGPHTIPSGSSQPTQYFEHLEWIQVDEDGGEDFPLPLSAPPAHLLGATSIDSDIRMAHDPTVGVDFMGNKITLGCLVEVYTPCSQHWHIAENRWCDEDWEHIHKLLTDQVLYAPKSPLSPESPNPFLRGMYGELAVLRVVEVKLAGEGDHGCIYNGAHNGSRIVVVVEWLDDRHGISASTTTNTDARVFTTEEALSAVLEWTTCIGEGLVEQVSIDRGDNEADCDGGDILDLGMTSGDSMDSASLARRVWVRMQNDSSLVPTFGYNLLRRCDSFSNDPATHSHHLPPTLSQCVTQV
jgi:hypothetical protein